MKDTIYRQDAIDALYHVDEYNGRSVEAIRNLPSAQSEPHYDEWCTDCKEYDQERHCCSRFNRVIRETLKEAQPEIIYCKDCKYLDIQGTYGECGKGILGIVNRDDFCSRAERRTDDLQ